MNHEKKIYSDYTMHLLCEAQKKGLQIAFSTYVYKLFKKSVILSGKILV